jgi:hypothetical protein
MFERSHFGSVSHYSETMSLAKINAVSSEMGAAVDANVS